jgi:OB-fold nucleic acid binding domain
MASTIRSPALCFSWSGLAYCFGSWMLLARSTSRALVLPRTPRVSRSPAAACCQPSSFRAKGIYRRQPDARSFVRRTADRRYGCLFSTAVDVEALQGKIKAKGDEIRSLKSAGISKEELLPHINELQALKAQLPADDSDTAKDANQGKKPAKKPSPQKQQPAATKRKSAASGGGDDAQLSESELRLNRLAKVQAMREAGVEPFAYGFDATRTASQLGVEYDGRLDPGEEDAEADVAVAGRILTRRVFGKLAFFTLQDETGIIQLQFDQNRLGDTFQVRGRLPPTLCSSVLGYAYTNSYITL